MLVAANTNEGPESNERSTKADHSHNLQISENRLTTTYDLPEQFGRYGGGVGGDRGRNFTHVSLRLNRGSGISRRRVFDWVTRDKTTTCTDPSPAPVAGTLPRAFFFSSCHVKLVLTVFYSSAGLRTSCHEQDTLARRRENGITTGQWRFLTVLTRRPRWGVGCWTDLSPRIGTQQQGLEQSFDKEEPHNIKKNTI